MFLQVAPIEIRVAVGWLNLVWRVDEVEDDRLQPDPPRALDVFRMRVGPSEMGDVKHARDREDAEGRVLAERILLRRRLGRLEPGDARHRGHRTHPKTVKDKYGDDQRILNPWVWNYTTATAVEIEM